MFNHPRQQSLQAKAFAGAAYVDGAVNLEPPARGRGAPRVRREYGEWYEAHVHDDHELAMHPAQVPAPQQSASHFLHVRVSHTVEMHHFGSLHHTD